MSIKIEVVSAEVATKSGTSSRTGKPYSIREQVGYAHVTDRAGAPKKFPVEIKVPLSDDQTPYAPGFYTVAPCSFYVDRFGGLTIGLELEPLAAAKAIKAA